MSTPHSTEINQAEINRATAQQSTGPETDKGKQRSSQNTLRHGLTSQMVVIPQEDPDVYDAHVEGFYREHQPQGATETALVQLLADTSWRLLRVATMEANIMVFDHNYGPLDNIVARITAIEKQTKSLANLSLHSQRLSRQFEKTLAQLRDLQQTRQHEKKPNLASFSSKLRLRAVPNRFSSDRMRRARATSAPQYSPTNSAPPAMPATASATPTLFPPTAA